MDRFEGGTTKLLPTSLVAVTDLLLLAAHLFNAL
jgi:hypothetical protein